MPLGDREAADRATEVIAWAKAIAEGDQVGQETMAPSGLNDEQTQRWGGVALLLLQGLYVRARLEPDKPLSAALDELLQDMIEHREFPPDE